MFNSKFFLIFNLLAFLALVASVYFQFDEIVAYKLDKTMFKSAPVNNSSSAATATENKKAE